MPERDIRKALKKRVEAYGCEQRAVVWLGRANAPDVLLFMHFSTVSTNWPDERSPEPYVLTGPPSHPFVETKAPNGEPTAAQFREHERMRKAGCTVLVISTFEQLDAFLPDPAWLPRA